MGSVATGKAWQRKARSTQQQSSESWPQYQFDSANTGYAPNNTPITSQPSKRWSIRLPAGANGTPVENDGAVYITATDDVYKISAKDGLEQWQKSVDADAYGAPRVHGDSVYVGTRSGSIYKFSKTDGTEQWVKTDLGQGYLTSPAVSANTIYTGDRSGTLFALDATDGNERWRYRTGEFNQSGSANVTIPVVNDGKVFISTGSLATGKGTVYAIDPTTGAEMWRSSIDIDPSEISNDESSLKVSKNSIFVGTRENGIYALDKDSGRVNWQFGDDVWGVEGVANGIVYGRRIGRRGPPVLHAFDIESGETLWQRENTWSEIRISENIIYEDRGDTLIAISTESGENKWKAKLTDSEGTQESELESDSTQSGPKLYFSRNEGIAAISLSEREQLWSFQAAGTLSNTPIIQRDRLYISDPENGKLRSISANTGSQNQQQRYTDDRHPLVYRGRIFVPGFDGLKAYSLSKLNVQWELEDNSFPRSSPVGLNGTVYYATTEAVYALDVEDGTVDWQVREADVQVESNLNRFNTIAAHDDSVYTFLNDGGYTILQSLSADGGTPRWKTLIGYNPAVPPSIGGERVYCTNINGIDDSSRGIHAINKIDGDKQWVAEFPVTNSPTIADGNVFAGSSDGLVYSLNASDGSERWKFETDESVTATPIVVNNTVYVGSTDNHLYALSATDGTERWRFETGDDVVAAPAVVDGTIYLPSTDGYLYALSGDEGESVSTQQAPNTETQNDTTTASTGGQVGMFEQFGDGSALPLGLAGGGLLGAAGLGLYRWRNSDSDEGAE